MKQLLLLLAALLLLASCAQPFLWYGNSSHKYYRYVKSPDEASLQAYKLSLQKVFHNSIELGLPVPPGLYCDYALLLVKEGNLSEAAEYFNKEKTKWIESTQMVDFLMSRYGLTH